MKGLGGLFYYQEQYELFARFGTDRHIKFNKFVWLIIPFILRELRILVTIIGLYIRDRKELADLDNITKALEVQWSINKSLESCGNRWTTSICRELKLLSDKIDNLKD